jgi:hypothetical protein
MKIRLSFVALLILLIGQFQVAPLYAATDVSGAKKYQVWVGKFPSDRVEGKTFLELPDIQRRIVKILGAAAVQDMKEMHVSFRAIEHRGWLLVSGCFPHLCVNAQWTVAINFQTGRTWVCLASLPSQSSIYGSSKDTLKQKIRNLNENKCPEGKTVGEQFDKFLPPGE